MLSFAKLLDARLQTRLLRRCCLSTLVDTRSHLVPANLPYSCEHEWNWLKQAVCNYFNQNEMDQSLLPAVPLCIRCGALCYL